MPPEPLVLGFDTSAAHCAAGLVLGDQLIALRHEPMEKGQAERLMPLLEELLAEADAAWRDLAAIGVGIGPGNFTGIRIAVSAARGLALALKIPAVGVSAFDALAYGLPRPILTTVDARRGMGYGHVLGGDEPPFIAPQDALPQALRASNLPVTGALTAWAKETGGPVLAPALSLPEAIARKASALRGEPQPRPAPLYLRSADAAPPSDKPPVILP